jgi:hypothetical protein
VGPLLEKISRFLALPYLKTRQTFAAQPRDLAALNEHEPEHNAVKNENERLIGENERLAKQVGELSERVGYLSSQVASLTENCNALRNRNERLTVQINAGRFDQAASEKREIAPRGSLCTPLAPRNPSMSNRERLSEFIIVSNMRAGSTWVETMLGALPDTATDYELKLGSLRPGSPAHLMLEEHCGDIPELFNLIDSDRPVVGSKLVLDPVELTRLDLYLLVRKLRRRVRVVHLVRSYRAIFLSRRRGFFHRLNSERLSAIGPSIREAIAAAAYERAPPSVAAQSVTRATCYEELKTYLHNDFMLRQIEQAGLPYFLVNYDGVRERFQEIASFVGSTAGAADLADAVARPPVLKLPAIEAGALVSNMAELEPLFHHFDALRRDLVGA